LVKKLSGAGERLQDRGRDRTGGKGEGYVLSWKAKEKRIGLHMTRRACGASDSKAAKSQRHCRDIHGAAVVGGEKGTIGGPYIYTFGRDSDRSSVHLLTLYLDQISTSIYF
jgi:hypothetical protein